MSSLSTLLLEQGVELEMRADFHEVISVLDQEIPQFACNGYGYMLTGGKGQLGVRWHQMVKLLHQPTDRLIDSPVGHIEIEKLDDGVLRFKIPPRAEMDYPRIGQFDPDGRYFGSFILQILNSFQRHQLINLPGTLPAV